MNVDEKVSKILVRIRKNFATRITGVIDSLTSDIHFLEENQDFRKYIKETLKDKNFHDNYPNSYRKFPFEIITFLANRGIPPEENFLILDIIDSFDIDNQIFVKFLITELIIDYFPKKFIEEKIFSKKKYYKLYRLYSGYSD